MIDFDKLAGRILCGHFSYACCLTPAQAIELTGVLSGATPGEVADFFRFICSCAAPGVQGGGSTTPTSPPGQPGPSDQCVSRFNTAICNPDTRGRLQQLSNALAAVLSGPSPLPADLKARLQTLKTNVDGLLFACQTGSAMVQKGVIIEFCSQLDAVKAKAMEMPDWLRSMARSLLISGLSTELLLSLKECCGFEMW